MKKQSVMRSILAAELVLLVPLIATMFTDEADWNIADFIIVGVLLAGIGFAAQLVISGLKNNNQQVVIGIVLAGAMLLIWAELAVGIFGSPFAGS